jgi:hypothetical protein
MVAVSKDTLKRIRQRCNNMQREYEGKQWKDDHRKIANLVDRRRGRFDEERYNNGDKNNRSNIYKPTATYANRVLQNGLQFGLTNKSTQWFQMVTPDSDLNKFKPVRRWLEERTNDLRHIFNISNAYRVWHGVYGEIGLFGTAAFSLFDDFEEVIHGRVYTIGEYYIDTNEKGEVDTFARKFKMTIRNLVRKFGIDNVSNSVRHMHENGQLEHTRDVWYLLQPNDDSLPLDRLSPSAYVDVYYEADKSDGVLGVQGYDSAPWSAPRWDVIGNDIWGSENPGHFAYGDIKELQLAQMEQNRQIAKVGNPPLVGPGKNKVINSYPGAYNFDSAQSPNSGLRPLYQINPDIQALEFKKQQLINDIREGFYNDLFLMLTMDRTAQQTATEVLEKQSEKLIQLGPVLERLERDVMQYSIDRTWNIMESKGMIPPAPPELEGRIIEAEFIGPLSQAQRMAGFQPILQTMSITAQVATMQPEVVDNLDGDGIVREVAAMNFSPSSTLKSQEEVDAKRQADAEAQQQMMAMEQAKLGADTAKTLSETEMAGNSVLDQML